MDGLMDPKREKWLSWIDYLIEGGILLFIFLFPVKEFIVSSDVVSLVKWMVLYVPLGLWILKMFIRKDFSLVRTPIDRPILLYSVVVIGSITYSIDRIETLAGIRGSYIKAIILYLIILNNFQTQEKVKRLGLTFAVSFLLTIGTGLLNYQMGQYNIIGGITAYGNKLHNIMGKILGGSFPFLLLVFSIAKRPSSKGIAIMLILVGFFAVFMTLSRATWVGAVFTVLIWGMYYNWKVITVALVLFLFTLFSFGPELVAERLSHFEAQKSTMSGRTPIWRVAIEQAKERPLLGYGYGLNIFEKVYQGGRTNQPSEEENVPHEHNLFLSLLIQTGIIGMSLYFWIFIGTLVSIYKLTRSISTGWDRDILVAVFSGMIGAYFIQAMFDRNNVGNWALPFWVMLAISMAIWNRVRESDSKNSRSQIEIDGLADVK